MRRRTLRAFIFAGALATLAACAADRGASSEEAVLFEARIDAQKFIAPLAPQPGKVMLGGYMRLSVTPLEFLIGPPRGISSIVVVMTDSPNLDLLDRIVVLGRFSKDGDFHVVQWSYARDGLCVEPRTATELRIETKMAAMHDDRRLRCAA